jgi:iron(III) transport system substrate-binding protein
MAAAELRLPLLAAVVAVVVVGCSRPKNVAEVQSTPSAERTVVCYSSTDQVFAEPILQAFEKQSGIKVKPKYDTEETKTTGLVNLIQQEKARPQADVFWSSETGRPIVLRAAGCLAAYQSPSAEGIPDQYRDPEGYWTGFSARARVILYNTDLVKGSPPSSLMDLLKPEWKGKAAIPNPLFGTSSFHATALFLYLGDDQALAFFRDAKVNGLQVLPSNGAVREAVGEGRAAWGIVDTDDANVTVKEGKPVKIVYPDQSGMGTPVMPNTVSLIAGAPHAEAGKKLIDYLLSPETERRLAEMDCVQMPLHPAVPTPPDVKAVGSIRAMDVDYAQVAANMTRVDKALQQLLGL